MAILLSGGGDPQDVIPLDKYFASIIDVRKTVLYIPIAMEPHVFSYDECFAWFKETYSSYGIYNVELCCDLEKLSLSNTRYAAVFIGGGNTFKLIDKIRRAHFADQLSAYLEAGGVLYGGSAGAIICGRTIEPAKYCDKNHVGLNDLTGLNLLNGCDVFCHYDPARHEAFVQGLSNDTYLLYEESGLVINGSEVLSIGKPFVWKAE